MLLALVPVLLAAGGCGTAPSDARGGSAQESTREVPSDATTVRATVAGGRGGISVTMPVRFLEARTLVRGDLLLQGRSRRASLAPRDGRDLDGPSLVGPLRIGAGVRVDVDGGWIASCAEPAGVPVLTVTSTTADGRKIRDRFVPADVAAYDEAFGDVCRQGLQGSVVGSRQDPDGGFSVDLTFVNPGPDEVTVTSEAYEKDGARWNAASVAVPVGKAAELRITGQGAGCVPATPWATGHLEANGESLKLPGGANEQC